MFVCFVFVLFCKLYRGWVGGGIWCRGWVEVYYIGGVWVEGVLFVLVILDIFKVYGYDCSEILIFSLMG